MNLTDILQQAGGIESMAKELGVSPGVAQQGADALLPAILGGFQKQAQGSGIEGLGGLIAGLGGGGLLDSVLVMLSGMSACPGRITVLFYNVPRETYKLYLQCSRQAVRSEEHTSELRSLMRISYTVFCLK